MPSMNIKGYMVEVQWDGNTLTAKGTNKAAHYALMGPNDVDINDYTSADESKADQWKGMGQATKAMTKTPDALVLERDQFTVTGFKLGNPFTNGNLTLTTSEGRKHQIHFRRKSNDDFAALHQALTQTPTP